MKLSSLFLLSIAGYLSLPSAEAGNMQVETTFREPKNVMFGSPMGGSSHMVWVLTIMEEMAARGHKAYYVTKADHLRFVKDFPHVEGVVSGEAVFNKSQFSEIMPQFLKMTPLQMGLFMVNNFGKEFNADYRFYETFYKQKNIDLAVCDHFDTACAEAAYNLRVPSVITSTLSISPDAAAPYINTEIYSMHHPVTSGLSFFERFNDRIVSPVRFLYGALPTIRKVSAERKKDNIPVLGHPMASWKHSLKLVNNVFGIEAGRPVGPLVKLIGPVLAKSYPELNEELKSFLDQRKKVVYVGFGQMAIPSTEQITMILTAMLENMESNDLDGIIWSTRGIEHLFPDYITTSANTTYDIRTLFHSRQNGNIAFVNWAPQVAILQHPSTALFLTHGGAGSMFEAMHSAVPMIFFPFFGDQPGTAMTSERMGFGRWMKRAGTQKEATLVVRDVARDLHGQYKRTLKRYQALVQIRSASGARLGADLMEEALFTHQDGKMVLQRDTKEDLHFITANNIDLYAVLILLLLTPPYALYRLALYYQAVTKPKPIKGKKIN
ncbi:hypothetical protein BY458DRAFT_519771 [Sporodiniella umbellata]|nr:hypothetical protein BY458DRAFT_519771 [Sporodiniella umbellata]